MMLNLPPYPKQDTPRWQGMTLEEIQMRRVLVQARMEISKFKLSAQVDGFRQRTPMLGGGKSVFSRVASAFTMAEYVLFAVKIFRTIAMLRKK